MGQTPIFGICLGHQVLGYAFGGTHFQTEVWPSRRESTGQRPDDRQGRDHFAESRLCGRSGFAPAEVEVTHINLNDGTVEGMRHRELPIFSVQYHPEAAPGPHDAGYFFAQFARLIEIGKQRGEAGRDQTN